MQNIDQKYVSLRSKMLLFAVGLGMGGANIIPGVSGGTIAFMCGIYEDLIASIKLVNIRLLRLVLTGKWGAVFENLPWRFLGALFSGVFLAIFSLAKVMSWLLENQHVLTFAFFFGLILATAPIIMKHIRRWNLSLAGLGLFTTLAMYWLVGLVPITTPESYGFLFFCGVIAIITMILPGISGSFVLVLLGKYDYIIAAINQRDLAPLIVFALGCGIGIVAFIRVLSWLLQKFHDPTMVILTGLVVGSLRKLWPWKEVLRSAISPRGKLIVIEEVNHWPGFTAEFFQAILVCVLGYGLAVFMARNEERMTRGSRG